MKLQSYEELIPACPGYGQAAQRGEALELNDDEVAFYDALGDQMTAP